jgi:SAM-dependent methyltransferase
MNVDPQKPRTGFDEYAQTYDAALAEGLSISGEDRHFFARRRIEILKKRLLAFNRRPAWIMDFGCGDGSSTPYLLGLSGVNQIVGIDVSAASITLARQKFENSTLSFRTPQECSEAAGFDLVFCNGVFHHIPVGERASAVSYVFNALRTGGLFAFWENNPWNPGTRLVMSRIPFDRDAITLSYRESIRMLRAGGFEILSTEFAFYFPRSLAFLRFIERFLSKVPFGAQYMVLGRKPE